MLKQSFTTKLRCGLVAALMAFIVPGAMAQTVTINWEDFNGAGLTDRGTFPPPASPLSVTDTLTGITSTFSGQFVTDGGAVPGAVLSDFVTFDLRGFGGPGGNVLFAIDNTTQDFDDRVVFIMTFSEPVINLNFDVLNLTTGGDAVQILFNASASGAQQNIVNVPAITTTPGAGIVRFTAGGTDGFQGTAGGNPDLDVNFGSQAVTSVRVEFFTGPGSAANPSLRLSGLGDLSFARAPPPPGQADLSYVIAPADTNPTQGANTFIDFTVRNAGAETVGAITASAALPSGLTFVSDDSGGAYNQATGVWTVPGTIVAGGSRRLRVVANVNATGNFDLSGEILSANQADQDSTPGNGAPGEDDFSAVTLTPVSPPPPLFCLGRPITPLAFANPVGESPGANPNAPQLNDVFRFPGVAPGVDALVTVAAFNGGASLQTIDNPTDGEPDNFQPTLLGPAGEVSVDFLISLVTTGTSTPGTLDFAGSVIDVDGNGAGQGLREYIEVSDNIVEFALNDPTELDVNATGPSTPGRVRFESRTDANAPGISTANPENTMTAFFTDVATFEFRIGKFGVDAGTGRLNSLAFNCPVITPSTATTNPLTAEDFGDAPFNINPAITPNYGNPIHVIDPDDPLVQLGATNTGEAGPGNSAAAATDAGDDGVTLNGGASLQGASFQGLVSQSLSIAVTNATADAGFLQAFFDWNRDGDFADAGEQVAVNVQDGDDNGEIILAVTPPAETVAGLSFARFRWATSSVGLEDPAGDGEVEDYQVTLLAADPADLSLSITASNTVPTLGDTISLTVTITNDGPADGSGITAAIILPAGLTFVSSDGGAAFDPATGIWTLPAPLPNGQSVALVLQVTVSGPGSSNVTSEIITAGRPDQDSTPGNGTTVPGEDDTDSASIVANLAPAVCPAGLSLSNQGGTAVSIVSQTSITNAGFALGALSAAGTSPPDPVAALINDAASSLLVLDLGVVVPENAALLFSLARDDDNAVNNAMLEIRHSLDPASFSNVLGIYSTDPASGLVATAPQNTLERFTVVVPSGGARYLQFDSLNGDNAFVDGISYDQSCLPGAELSGSKTVTVFDPLAEGLFALPGNDVIYRITVRNIGAGPADDDSIFLIDELPPEVIFFNGDADGPGAGTDPVNFEDIVATGLDPFVFTDSVRFAGAGPAPGSFGACTLAVDPGFDADVRYVCFNPKGIMNAGDPDPEFSLSFRVRIR